MKIAQREHRVVASNQLAIVGQLLTVTISLSNKGVTKRLLYMHGDPEVGKVKCFCQASVKVEIPL